MRAAIGWLVVASLMYFGLQQDGPTPELRWRPYATNMGTGKIEWLWAGPYKTLDECNFNADKAAKRGGGYTSPNGCLYEGFQNPYVLWAVNTAIGAGRFKCIAKMTNRSSYTDAIYSPVLKDYPSDRGNDWVCAVP